jgi:hypothetical protein
MSQTYARKRCLDVGASKEKQSDNAGFVGQAQRSVQVFASHPGTPLAGFWCKTLNAARGCGHP